VNLATIIEKLNLRVLSGVERLSNEVKGGYVGDLLSDVIANSKESDIWITRQVHQNIVAVATLRDLAGIILVHGNEPAADTLAKAVKEGIPIMVSERPGFELAGQLYNLIVSKVDIIIDAQERPL
jgi:hypothetical protein